MTNRIQDCRPTAAQSTNLLDLITALRISQPAAEVTKNAYDGAVSLHWEGYEIAAYDDHFETYECGDGETIIHHWPHVSGAAVATELVDEVSKALAKGA